jgi:hypothetical protein
VSTPGGKEHLAAQLAWLQGKYVRFVAAAHSDAINRARQLQFEVRAGLVCAGGDQEGVEGLASLQQAWSAKPANDRL